MPQSTQRSTRASAAATNCRRLGTNRRRGRGATALINPELKKIKHIGLCAEGVGSPSCLGVLGAAGEPVVSAPPPRRGVVSIDDSMDACVRLIAPPRTMLSMAARDCRKVARLPSLGCANTALPWADKIRYLILSGPR